MNGQVGTEGWSSSAEQRDDHDDHAPPNRYPMIEPTHSDLKRGIILLEGFGQFSHFSLPPAVMALLVGSTAVSAIGFVVNGLFREIK
jgi:hypothetical protein